MFVCGETKFQQHRGTNKTDSELHPVLEELPEASPVPSTNLNGPVLYVALPMEPCFWHKALLPKQAGLLVQNHFPHSRTCPRSIHSFPRFIKCFFILKPLATHIFTVSNVLCPWICSWNTCIYISRQSSNVTSYIKPSFSNSTNSLLVLCHKTTTHL